MSRKRIIFSNGDFYHIIKRGIEKRNIFLDEEDNLRFINSLLVFNDESPCIWESRAFWSQREPSSLMMRYSPKEPLVEIHAFTLMKNHFHLILRQLRENGMVKFLRKLGGYSYYFNKKYKREGTLFDGRYKAISIDDEKQLRNSFIYVNTNQVGIIEADWKDLKVRNVGRALNFLENEYRWSSFWDYIGKPNFPRVISRDFFLDLYGGEEGIKREVKSWIEFKNEMFKDSKKLEKLKKMMFE